MLALLYDIHGNLPALEAVLGDAESEGATRYVLGGDYALFGAWPREVVERLSGLEAVWIRGNGERWTADPAEAPKDKVVQGAIVAARQLLGAEAVAELADLPETSARGETLYCHGSPGSDVLSFGLEPGVTDAELLEGVTERRVVFGHTHVPFVRDADGIELCNPGSVGMSLDGNPRASYALVDQEGAIAHRRVRYDHAAAARAVRERFPDFGEVIARRIEAARLAG